MITVRAIVRHPRHRSAVAAALAIVALLVVWEHAGEPEPHMEDAGAFCLAVVSGLTAVGLLADPTLLSRARLPRPRSTDVPLDPIVSRASPLPASRAGPLTLQVLRR